MEYKLIEPEEPNFVKYCLMRGADIIDLIIPTEDSMWPGLCNPSIFNDNGDMKLVLRNVNYVMHNSTFANYNWSEWGPLQYIVPQEDAIERYLKTRNYICSLNDDGIVSYNLVNTSKYDKKPKWEFVGHEDARLVRWDGKLYMTGVRRDDNSTGIGRMSLCTIDGKYNEVSRKKIDHSSFGYCEKNWMPIIDKPYHYIRTTCPETNIVKVDPKTGNCEFVDTIIQDNIELSHDMMIRGSSQVIPWKGMHIALVHTCNLIINELGKKVSRYHFHFVVWDEQYKIIKISKLFTFNDFNIEFSNGLALKGGKFYIPFALQDNMSFLLTVPEDTIYEFIFDEPKSLPTIIKPTILTDFFIHNEDPESISELARHYYDIGFKAGAYCLFQRAFDFETDVNQMYERMFWQARTMADLGHRDPNEYEFWMRLIDIDSYRPEGYFALYKYFFYRGYYNDAYHNAKLALEHSNNATFYYDASIYEPEYCVSMLYTGMRPAAIQWFEAHKDEYPEYYKLYNIILDSQPQIQRIL